MSLVKKSWLSFCCIGLMLFVQSCSQVNQVDKSMPFNYPFDGEIYIQYGNQIHPEFRTPDFHTGIDILAPEGSDLIATADGTVEETGWDGGYGNRVIIDHGNNLKTLYAHCSEILVKKGDKIRQGQVIAKSGRTGTATEPHVHYEIIQDGKQIDPEAFNNDLLNKMKK